MNKNEKTLERVDITYIEEMLLDERGLYKAVSAELLHSFPLEHLQVFANDHAIYQLVTTELIDWLRQEIGHQAAMETHAGNGIIARSLGIIGIDSRVQETAYFQKRMIEKYGPLEDQFARTKPPREIKKYETLDAIRVFRPEILIGAFVTPKCSREDNSRGIQGNGYGPDMPEVLKRVRKYIHIGNINTHLPNPIYDLPHRELAFPWLVSRALDQSLNRIWIWENK